MRKNTTARRKRADKRRIWVVECHFKDGNGKWGWKGGSWDICYFTNANLPYVSVDYFECHKMKRKIAYYLTGKYKTWSLYDFRVSAYVPKKGLTNYDELENDSRFVHKRVIRLDS